MWTTSWMGDHGDATRLVLEAMATAVDAMECEP